MDFLFSTGNKTQTENPGKVTEGLSRNKNTITRYPDKVIMPRTKSLGCVQNPQRQASLSSKAKARAIKQILDSLPEQVPTLRRLEKEFSLSRIHLEHGFRELYGMTIGNYSKTIKLRTIKELLKDYTLTMDTIAIRTGFNGGEALNRFFKNKEGITPGQWRRAYFNSIH